MIALAALALAVQQTAMDAERAFAAMAQTEGQNRAFLHWSSPQAIMFAPEATNVHQLLEGRPNRRTGLMWWPGRSWVSCDGGLAINTGPSIRRGGTGTFTTVWQRRPDGQWRWLLDHGRATPRAVPASDSPPVAQASCSGRRTAARAPEPLVGRVAAADVLTGARADLLVQEEGAMPAPRPSAGLAFEAGPVVAEGGSDDRTLLWRAQALTGGEAGARLFTLHIWDGRAYRLALMEVTGLRSQ